LGELLDTVNIAKMVYVMGHVITEDLLIPASGMCRSHPAAHERDKGKQRNMASTTFRKHCKFPDK